ncbi:ureidoglycolate lyase [Psychromarinibacter sp. S121]|uniref:ureidoglycolate lyase n=1 Tax=Psychromarinibacter sp. S121 TaxID=3415127 RepID=UPI003C7C336F
MSLTITAQPLTASAFASFGDVLEAAGEPDKIINQGLCGRFHDRARMDFGPGGRAGISVFQAELRDLPLTLDMVERHPEGSQAFLPLDREPFLVIVAEDEDGKPGTPRAFVTAPGQGVNYMRNCWHGVLTPVAGNGLFAVVDRIGDTPNLEEFWFETPFRVTLP